MLIGKTKRVYTLEGPHVAAWTHPACTVGLQRTVAVAVFAHPDPFTERGKAG